MVARTPAESAVSFAGPSFSDNGSVGTVLLAHSVLPAENRWDYSRTVCLMQLFCERLDKGVDKRRGKRYIIFGTQTGGVLTNNKPISKGAG